MTELPIVSEPRQKKPDWLRVKLPIGEEYKHVRALLIHISFIHIVKAAIVPIWVNAGAQALQLS
jgi:lipoate synthase